MSVNIYQINVQTRDFSRVKVLLSDWIEDVHGRRAEVLSRQDSHFDFFENEVPTLFAAGVIGDGWVTILHDSYDKLKDFTRTLSSEIDGLVVHTLGQSTVDTYYLSVHQNGRLIRELYCGEDTDGVEQSGDPFPFESDLTFSCTDDSCFIDYEYLEEFCGHLGINSLMEPEAIDGEWEILKLREKKSFFNMFNRKK